MNKCQCYVMEASYKMVEDLRISILSDSVVSQFLLSHGKACIEKAVLYSSTCLAFEAIGIANVSTESSKLHTYL